MSNLESKTERIRKAWLVTVKGYDNPEIFHASTATKARMKAWRSLDSGDIRVVDISVRRWSIADVKLPTRDPIADQLAEDETHCLLHAFGANQGAPEKAGYRDYFYTRRDDPPLVGLASRGLMKPMPGDAWGENMTYFVLTPAGRHVALSLVPEYGING